MKQTVTFHKFMNAFHSADRGSNFSYDGLKALFSYLMDCEDTTGEEIELDVISLCIDFTEYPSIKRFWEDYDKESFPTYGSIESATLLIPLDSGGFIIENF